MTPPSLRYIFAFFLLLFVGAQMVSAQGLYFRGGLGYAGNFGLTDYDRHNNSEYTAVGFGRGLNLGVAAGYRFNEFLAGELGLGYLGILRKEWEDSQPGVTTTLSTRSGVFTITPAIVISPFENTVAPYARIGAFFGVGSTEQVAEFPILGVATTTTTTNTGGLAAGFQGALGIRFGISDNLSFYSEMFFTNAARRPTTWESVAEGGGTTVTTEGDYVENPSPVITQRAYVHEAFNNLGLNVGVQIAF